MRKQAAQAQAQAQREATEAAAHRTATAGGVAPGQRCSEAEANIVARLREALGADFRSFQRSFQMHVDDADRQVAPAAAVALALRTAARAPAAPAVLVLLEAVAAHNEGSVVMRRVVEAIGKHGYTREHGEAASRLQLWGRALVARLRYQVLVSLVSCVEVPLSRLWMLARVKALVFVLCVHAMQGVWSTRAGAMH